MTRTWNRVASVLFSAVTAIGGCKTNVGELSRFLACDDQGQCVDGYRCAQLDIGPTCLDEAEWMERCGAGETCNGRDNDCDGDTDEDFEDVVTGTDIGECSVRVERCQGGELVVIEDGVPPIDETCNGLDDDCDGISDGGVPSLVTGVTIGECRVTVSECLGGEYVVVITGVDPVLETCNGRDDDCDEDTDEDFPTLNEPCTNGTGACRVGGVYRCRDDGDGVVCDAVAGNPGAEVCDGVDNNCDGVADEIFTELGDDCSVGIGACLAEGERVCRADGLGTVCDVESADPIAETCNGDDDDCDGVIDNGLPDCCVPGATRPCGVQLGTCTVGTQTCTPERSWGACSGQGPVADVCNGLDDDCDGEADEGLAGCCGTAGTTIPCSVDRGACVAGVQTCGADGAWSACSGALPTLDRCDGDDNDCDGETDEDFADLGDECSVDRGACEAFGERVCTEDGVGTTCGGAIPGIPSTESCNRIDDDCDGEVDDGLVTYTGTDVGECQQGIERCIDGAIVTVQERVDPVAETCDGLDQDCDGIVDESAPDCCTPGQVRTCGIDTGLCTVGSQICGSDFRWSDCSGQGPQPERCDGLDQDCSGTADDPWALQLDGACTNGRGACVRSGSYRCAEDGSATVCDAVSGDPGTEICNGVDDDCDGSVDETADLPPLFIGSDVGDCESVVIACVNGTMREVDPGVGASPETCDGRDNDCSGTPDDGIPSVSCYTGPVGTEGVGICAGGSTTCAGGTLLCVGQSLPVAETCDGFDNNCDEVVDGSYDGSGNPVALAQPCYGGPPGTLGVGECIAGTTTCLSGVWGDCVGEVTPATETCGDGLDQDCDTIVDGIRRTEDFEDPSCGLAGVTFVQDPSSMSCAVTPTDVSDPTRTPAGSQSLLLSIVRGSNDRYAALEWRFEACAPTATGSISLSVVNDTPGDMMLQVSPVFIGNAVEFFYYGAGDAEVLVRDGEGTTVNERTVLLGTSEWHELSWSLTATGQFTYALDGAEFFSETIESSIIGIHLEFHVLRTPGANPRVLIDDATLTSP